MLQINQLLERFKNITNTEGVKKQLIMEILISNKIPINKNQISFSKNNIFLKVPPIIRTEIILKKQSILEEIRKISVLSNIEDIK